jgi:hypothetical protein
MEVTMNRPLHRSLLIAVAGLFATLPAGISFGDQQPPGGVSQQVPHGMPCAKRTEVVRILRENFGEHPVGHGLADSGAVAELFSSSKGTWTIVATSPNGVSCMVGSGESWQTTIAREDTI